MKAGSPAFALGFKQLPKISAPTVVKSDDSHARSRVAKPIDKRVRWFIDGETGLVSNITSEFFENNSDVFDGFTSCCGFGKINGSGVFTSWWDHEDDADHSSETVAVHPCNSTAQNQRWTFSEPVAGYIKTHSSPAHGKTSRCL